MNDSTDPLLMEKPEVALNEVNLASKEVIKTSDHSPARSSVKSFKASVVSKTSSKSIPKSVNNNLAGKMENKSHTGLLRNETKKISSISLVKNTTTNSSKSVTPTGKSKIPAFNRTPKQTINTKTKTEQKSLGSKQQPSKSRSQISSQETKKLQPKREVLNTSNSKSNINQSEISQSKAMTSSISKASFVKTSAFTQSNERNCKSQSARSSSATAKTLTNKRSASNISNRSIPCPPRNLQTDTNLRKMLSNSGDHIKTDKDSVTKLQKTEISDKSENFQEIINGYDKSSLESVDVIKNKIKSHVQQWFSNVKDEFKDFNKSDVLGNQEIQEKLENLQILKSHDILSLIDDFCSNYFENSNLQMNKLKIELEESKKTSRKEEEQLKDLIKQQEEHLYKWEKELKETAEKDIAKKNEEINELQKKSKSLDKELSNLKSSVQNLKKERENLLAERDHLQEDLLNSRECISITNKKLQQIEQQLSHEKKEQKLKIDIIKKLEMELEDKKKMEINVKEMLVEIEELENQIKIKSLNECVGHLKEIEELKNKIKQLEITQNKINGENFKLQQEIQALAEVKNKLKEAEDKIKELHKKSEDKEITPDFSKDQQLEFSKLRQSDTEKRREIEKLKIELSKSQFNICQLEQQIQRDQQLLEVRSELIKSLQANEKTHRIHLEELFAQVSEKNTTINELNCELQNKSEEFRNLFNNLSAKQVEVSNQEHIIKLLEESNERSQLLRVKQEEKIGRMEDELAHLKQTIAIYQTNILTGNQGKHLLLAPVLPPSNVDYNENFYYYVNQRKRKRQVDINVKKYEA